VRDVPEELLVFQPLDRFATMTTMGRVVVYEVTDEGAVEQVREGPNFAGIIPRERGVNRESTTAT
jgi:hypothetical protein